MISRPATTITPAGALMHILVAPHAVAVAVAVVAAVGGGVASGAAAQGMVVVDRPLATLASAFVCAEDVSNVPRPAAVLFFADAAVPIMYASSVILVVAATIIAVASARGRWRGMVGVVWVSASADVYLDDLS